MKNIKPILQAAIPNNFVGVGTVNLIKSDSPYYGVSLQMADGELDTIAYKAEGLTASLNEGDRVLCVAGPDKTLYLSTLLERAVVKNVSAEKNESVEVVNTRNELIFEYDAENDRSRVIVGTKNLDIALPDGNINLDAGGQINLSSHRIAMSSGEKDGAQHSSFLLTPFNAYVRSPVLDIKSRIAKLDLDQAHYVGNKLFAKIKNAKLVWGKLEVLADKVVNKLKVRHTTVEQLEYSKIGRLRSLVSGSYRVKAERMNLKTEKSVNIDGERINLG